MKIVVKFSDNDFSYKFKKAGEELLSYYTEKNDVLCEISKDLKSGRFLKMLIELVLLEIQKSCIFRNSLMDISEIEHYRKYFSKVKIFDFEKEEVYALDNAENLFIDVNNCRIVIM